MMGAGKGRKHYDDSKTWTLKVYVATVGYWEDKRCVLMKGRPAANTDR